MSSPENQRLGFGYGELVLLLAFGLFSAGLFVGSYRYPGFAGAYPRAIAAITFVSVVFLLIRNYLPHGRFYRIFFVSPEMFSTGRGDDGSESPIENPEPLSETEDDTALAGRREWMTSNRGFIVLSTGGYLVLGYLIGLLWATPLYVFFHLRWMDEPWLRTVALTVAMFAVAYVFVVTFHVPIANGLLQELLGVEIYVEGVG